MSGLGAAFREGAGAGLGYASFRTAAWLAEHLPVRAGNAAARLGGLVAYRVARGKRRIVRRNLARVVGEGPRLESVVRAAFLSYARYWLETFRLGRYSREELLRMVDTADFGRLETILAAGRGAVIVTPHFGFYDLGGAWIAVKGHPITTVAEVLRPRALFEWFAALRERLGMHILPASPGEAARRRLQEALFRGEALALVADRDLSRRGLWVELFGERTTVPAGPAVLVARTGAPLLAAAVYARDGRYSFEFEEIPCERRQDVEVIAGRIAAALERLVRRAPEQWHLFSTNWPSDEPHLPPRGTRARQPAGP